MTLIAGDVAATGNIASRGFGRLLVAGGIFDLHTGRVEPVAVG